MSEFKLLLIDTAAGTPIQSYNGDPATLDFLKYDISSFVHYVRTQGSTLIIGRAAGVMCSLRWRSEKRHTRR